MGVLPDQGRGIFLCQFISVLQTHFLMTMTRTVAWLQHCKQDLVARDVHAWDRLPLAVANPGAVDLEAGVSQMGACACGVLLPGQGGRQVLHVPPDPNPCTTAGPQSLQTWVLLSMRPAKPGDCFRGISGILCTDSLWHERLKAEWLRQSLCVSPLLPLQGLWGLVLSLVVSVCAWATSQAGMGRCQAGMGRCQAQHLCSTGTPPKEAPEESAPVCCGTDHPRGEWD